MTARAGLQQQIQTHGCLEPGVKLARLYTSGHKGSQGLGGYGNVLKGAAGNGYIMLL